MFSPGIVRMKSLAVFLMMFISWQSQANIIISGTRVIYNEKEKEVTVKLSNSGTLPVVAQSWLDNGDINARPEGISVPFIITPPINRINAGKSQTLRVSYTASQTLPKDKESVFWLNVLEIPGMKKDAAANRLQIAFRTRVKLFYRPTALADKAKASEAAEKLTWQIDNGQLKANNASPYYVSLASVTINSAGRKESIEGEMVTPQQSQAFKFKDAALLRPGATITYEYVNDWGAVKLVNTQL